MVLLPLPHALGVFLIPKIVLASGLFQPRFLTGSLAGLLTLRLETEPLTFPMPVVRKEKFLAVEAVALALLSLHRFLNQRNQLEEKSEAQTEENPRGRRTQTAKKEEYISVNQVRKTEPKKIHFQTARSAGILFRPWQPAAKGDFTSRGQRKIIRVKEIGSSGITWGFFIGLYERTEGRRPRSF